MNGENKTKENILIVLDIDGTQLESDDETFTCDCADHSLALLSLDQPTAAAEAAAAAALPSNRKKKDDEKEMNRLRLRPFVRRFLHFVFASFQYVAIWTANPRGWADLFIAKLRRENMLPTGADFCFVYTSDKCRLLTHPKFGDDAALAQMEMGAFKPLKKIWRDQALQRRLNAKFTRHNTIIVDDKSYTFVENRGNALLVSSWTNRQAHLLATWLRALAVYFFSLSSSLSSSETPNLVLHQKEKAEVSRNFFLQLILEYAGVGDNQLLAIELQLSRIRERFSHMSRPSVLRERVIR